MKRFTVTARDCKPKKRCLLVSIRPRHALDILTGIKTFEFRRVSPRLIAGDDVVIYSTAPIAAIVGRFQVTTVLSRSPAALWRQVSARPGLTKAEFRAYFRGRPVAHAIGVGDVDILQTPLALAAIRAELPGFAPPQSYWYLDPVRADDAILFRRLGVVFERSLSVKKAG